MSSETSSSPSGKRSRDPEDEVYIDNLHSHKRYLSEVCFCHCHFISVTEILILFLKVLFFTLSGWWGIRWFGTFFSSFVSTFNWWIFMGFSKMGFWVIDLVIQHTLGFFIWGFGWFILRSFVNTTLICRLPFWFFLLWGFILERFCWCVILFYDESSLATRVGGFFFSLTVR